MLDINIIKNVIKACSNSCVLPHLKQINIQSKPDGSLVTQVDIAVQKTLQTELHKHFPEYGFFAEELSDDEVDDFFAENNQGFWCLDPLDGTSNFTTGLPFFAISLALILDGETKLGVVYDPMRDECFSAIKGEGAYLNNQMIQVPDEHHVPTDIKQCMAMIDLKRLSSELSIKLVSEPAFRSQRSFGAAALEWCWLAMGRSQLYLHGKHMLWDYAAGLLIAEEAGCYTCDINGNKVFEVSLKAKAVVAAINKSLHKQWFAYIST